MNRGNITPRTEWNFGTTGGYFSPPGAGGVADQTTPAAYLVVLGVPKPQVDGSAFDIERRFGWLLLGVA